jgi:hypothetical protein
VGKSSIKRTLSQTVRNMDSGLLGILAGYKVHGIASHSGAWSEVNPAAAQQEGQSRCKAGI